LFARFIEDFVIQIATASLTRARLVDARHLLSRIRAIPIPLMGTPLPINAVASCESTPPSAPRSSARPTPPIPASG
jgi:hypothetical protein